MASSAPDAGDLTTETDRSSKRMLDCFVLQCSRRGPDCVMEGSLFVLSSLWGAALGATNGTDLRLQAFSHLRECPDRLYWYTPEVRLPGRCGKSLVEFVRLPKEELETARGTRRIAGSYASPAWISPTCSPDDI